MNKNNDRKIALMALLLW